MKQKALQIAGRGAATAGSSFARSACRALSASPSPIDTEEPSREDTFRAADLRYELTTTPQPKPSLKGVKFGTVFTDHMLEARYLAGSGWGAPAVKPLAAIQLHPAAQVLHYGMCCFEGLKAYHGADGRTRLFRPDMNAARLRRSARRLQLADFDPEELLGCLRALLRVEAGWMPREPGYSVYVRPFMFSSAGVLGVAKSTETTLCTLLSPVGPYFPSGLQPIRIFLDEAHARAWPGGVGEFKVGCNYAPTILPQVEAAAPPHRAQQVLYTQRLPGSDPDDAAVEESGAMNIFFLLDTPGVGRELVTPPLGGGTILPGVTRDSILELTRGWGEFAVSERRLAVGEVKQAAAEGRLLEVFGCGTACLVQPVSALVRGTGEEYQAHDSGSISSLAARLQQQLLDIQYGRQEHPWSVPVD